MSVGTYQSQGGLRKAPKNPRKRVEISGRKGKRPTAKVEAEGCADCGKPSRFLKSGVCQDCHP
jgi:hypothetical protein